MSRWLPILTLAAGILLGTAISTLVNGWLVLLGPLVMAGAVVVAAALQRNRRPDLPGRLKSAWIVAGGLFLACALVALRDPDLVAMTVALVGASSFVVLTSGRRKREERC